MKEAKKVEDDRKEEQEKEGPHGASEGGGEREKCAAPHHQTAHWPTFVHPHLPGQSMPVEKDTSLSLGPSNNITGEAPVNFGWRHLTSAQQEILFALDFQHGIEQILAAFSFTQSLQKKEEEKENLRFEDQNENIVWPSNEVNTPLMDQWRNKIRIASNENQNAATSVQPTLLPLIEQPLPFLPAAANSPVEQSPALASSSTVSGSSIVRNLFSDAAVVSTGKTSKTKMPEGKTKMPALKLHLFDG